MALSACAVACTNDFDEFGFVDDAGAGAASGSGGTASAGAGGSAGAAAGGTSGSAAQGAGVVSCANNDDCSLKDNICCRRFSGPSCQAKDADCSPGSDIACDGPEDCEKGQVCCARFVGPSVLSEMRCASAGDCSGQGRRVVCGDDPSVCPDQQKCEKLNQAPYQVCRP